MANDLGFNIAPNIQSLVDTNNINYSFKTNDNIICGKTFYTLSDSRIKKNIIDINDNDALIKIMNIEPKIYNYIDKISRNSSLVYGFIAQQIKEIIPEAVEITSDYIPNIYKTAYINNNIIQFNKINPIITSNTLIIDSNYQPIYISNNSNDNSIISNLNDNLNDNSIISNLKINDDLLIFSKNSLNFENCRILYLTSNQIIIDNSKFENDEIFIYGTKVNDLHMLDKSYIFTLNVCATQDLFKEMNELNNIIDNQNKCLDYLINN